MENHTVAYFEIVSSLKKKKEKAKQKKPHKNQQWLLVKSWWHWS